MWLYVFNVDVALYRTVICKQTFETNEVKCFKVLQIIELPIPKKG